MRTMKTGFPKIKISGTGTFKPPTTSLTRESKVGDRVAWTTLSEAYVGILKEWDSNVAIITLENGKEKAVET